MQTLIVLAFLDASEFGDPRMVNNFLSRDAVFRVVSETFFYQVFGLFIFKLP